MNQFRNKPLVIFKEQNTITENQQPKAWIAIACISFFPLMYFIGRAIMPLLAS